MPRPKQTCPPGEVFHVRNRAIARMTLFANAEDDDAFLRALEETWRRAPMPIYAFTALPDHWRFVVRPARRGQIGEFFRRLSVTHATRCHAHYGKAGSGHVYQGRFKSFPVQGDERLLAIMQYAARNPLRANLVERAEAWRWGSCWARRRPAQERPWLTLSDDPPLPRQWIARVNKPQAAAKERPAKECIRRGAPFGDERWTRRCVVRLGLQSTLRPCGRPRKIPDPSF